MRMQGWSATLREELRDTTHVTQCAFYTFLGECAAVLRTRQLAAMLSAAKPWPPDALQLTSLLLQMLAAP